MNCSEAQPWLLATGDSSQLSKSVREHLRTCAACRRGWRLRGRIDEALRQSGPPSPEAACQRFLTGRFARETSRSRPRRWPWWCAVAAGLLLAVGIGLILWPRGSRRIDTPVVQTFPDESVIERFLRRNLRLANSDDPIERVHLLAAGADDLATAGLARAESESLDGLALASDLYIIAIEGLVLAVRALPADQKGVRAEVIENLRDLAIVAEERAVALPPARKQRLSAIAESARQAATALSNDKPLPRRDLSRGNSPDEAHERLAVLVRQSVRLAGSTEPLARAETCADLADHWLEAILFAAARGDGERAEILGQQLAEIEDGMEDNEQLTPADAERLARRAGEARQKLEDNLNRASPAGRDGLQRAKQAVESKKVPPGWRDRSGKQVPPGLRDRPERDKGSPGKGKGKGKGKSDKP
jgi:hypothetical protein